MFEIYKPTQGKYTRMTTFLSAGGLILIGGKWLSDHLGTWGTNVFVQYLAPLVVVAGLLALVFRVVNKERTADFLIATEGEMKKVSWSNRREIIGSTKVVIFATLSMAVMLFVVDLIFSWFFERVGVMIPG
jgi:preprotein translocase subunit SecE